MKVSIIAAALPPQLDGIGDYAANLAAELAKSETVTVLTSKGFSPSPMPGVTIRQVFDVAQPASVRNVLPILEADAPDWALLQYNPFSYGRWGLNLALPQAMREIKRRTPGTKFALMMHEPFVPIISVPFAVMTTWQRWQLWQLGRAADLMFCSIDPWARRFARWFPKTPVHHLPVGSNIPRVPITRAEARARLGIADGTLVLGLFGGSAQASRMLGHVKGAAETVVGAGRDVLVLYMGPNAEMVCRELGDVPTLAEGPLPGEEISRRFSAVDIALAPFVDGVSTRRTSLMTALQHGVATVGTRGHSTDMMLNRENGRALLLADVGHRDGFNAHIRHLADSEGVREQAAQEAQRLYEREFAWPVIGARQREMMREAQS